MTWPTDTLTNSDMDQGTDLPHLSRVELNEAILMIKSILSEAPAGSLILTNQDEGIGNGLDADTVDGLHASSFSLSSHNHSAANITSGTLPVTRGGTGRATFPQYQPLVGNGAAGVLTIYPAGSGAVLMSNGPSAWPTFNPLPSYPTVDVHASDFFNSTRAVYPNTGSYTLNTGFGTNNFQWGISGISGFTLGTYGIIVGRTVANGWAFYPFGDIGGSVAYYTGTAAASTGYISFSIRMAGASAHNVTVHVWARKNI